MAKPTYGNKQKVKGKVLARSRRRAKALGSEQVLKGGVTGAEARTLKQSYQRKRGGSGAGGRSGAGAGAGIQSRAKDRLGQIGPVGGVNEKDGISRPEARKVRRAWETERQFDPNRPRGGRDILNQAEALTNLEYAPQEAELGRTRQNQAGRTNVMASWFGQYQAQVAEQARQQQAAGQAFQQGAYAASQQAFAADTAGVGQRQGQAQQGAAQMGAVTDPAVAMQAQQAAGARLAQGTAFGTTLGQMGQANANLMGQRAASAGQQRVEVLRDEQARAQKIDQLALELSGQRASSKTATVGKLQDAEHTKTMERQAFGLDVTKEQADAAADAATAADREADNKRAGRNDRSTRRDRRADNRRADADDAEQQRHNLETEATAREKSRNSSSGGSGGSPKYSQSQRNGNARDMRAARSLTGGLKGKPSDLIGFLVRSKGFDPLVARAAVAPGSLNRRQRTELRRMGIKAGGRSNSNQHPTSLPPRNADGTPG